MWRSPPWSTSAAPPGGWPASPARWWRRSGTTSPPPGRSGDGDNAENGPRHPVAGAGPDRASPDRRRDHPPHRGRGLLPALGAAPAAGLPGPPADDRLVDPRGGTRGGRYAAGRTPPAGAGPRAQHLADLRPRQAPRRAAPDRLPRRALVQRHPDRMRGRHAGDPRRAGESLLDDNPVGPGAVLGGPARRLVAGRRRRRWAGGALQIFRSVPRAPRAPLALAGAPRARGT